MVNATMIYNINHNGKKVEVIDSRKNAMNTYNNMKHAEELASLRKRENVRKRKHLKRIKFVNDVKFALGLASVTVLPMFAMIMHYCFTTGY